eukprot:1158816-Pelagomonas_calceolata.AAC.2
MLQGCAISIMPLKAARYAAAAAACLLAEEPQCHWRAVREGAEEAARALGAGAALYMAAGAAGAQWCR